MSPAPLSGHRRNGITTAPPTGMERTPSAPETLQLIAGRALRSSGLADQGRTSLEGRPKSRPGALAGRHTESAYL
jgi:hypothetical protein